ncbi:MAG: cation-translocating P-type ATPase [Clostridia bacterium]|nr:cation-translocating P-type ATPase [Clostridia bacterium]
MKKRILNIEGMTCSACSGGLEKYLNKQPGIEYASVNLVMAQAQIEYDEKKLSASDLDRFVKEAGFKSLGDDSSTTSRKSSFRSLIVFAVLAIFLMYISMGEMFHLPVPRILDKMENPKGFASLQMGITILFLIWGFDIIKNGFKNLIHGMPNMDSLVGIGVLINFFYSFYNTILIYQGNSELAHNLYFESSAMIVLFVKIGRFIDKTNKAKAVDTIKNLVTITPQSGTILKDGIETLVPINEIKKGDIVISRPGEKIAVDGTVMKGQTHTDESFITGESTPVSKKEGSKVLAGSINYDGYIEYVAENIGKDSSISHIVDLVVEATNSKAPIARLADKISSVFVPVIFSIAVITGLLNLFIGNSNEVSLMSVVTVLVVACPCSFGLATPLSMVVAIGNASKNGIVIKSSASLENLNQIDTVAFDKTGTLTKGEMEIADSKFIGNKEAYLNVLKSLEAKSNHPLAKGICKSGADLYQNFEVEEFEEIPGQGVTGKVEGVTYYAGNKKLFESQKIKMNFEKEEKLFTKKGESIVFFGSDLGVFGIVGLKDTMKPTAEEAISKLIYTSKKKVIMLSGDNTRTAREIAEEVGIKDIYAEMSPKEKMDKIHELNQNQNVLMVGDGINDSPSLKSAAIGVSVANGTDISSDSSDIILLSEDMKKIPYLFELGSKTIRIIKQNLIWALFYNVLMIPLATGFFPIKLNPMIAALAMVFSSLTVVLNSLRLRKI